MASTKRWEKVRTASEKALQGILREHPAATVEELIRLALKKL